MTQIKLHTHVRLFYMSLNTYIYFNSKFSFRKVLGQGCSLLIRVPGMLEALVSVPNNEKQIVLGWMEVLDRALPVLS